MKRRPKILFVGAGFVQAQAIKRSKELGFEPYVIDGKPNSPGFEFAVKFAVGDIRDPKFIECCAKRYHVNGIVSISTDVAVSAVARASISCGFPSISPEAADISTNKLMQRRAMANAELTVPKFTGFASLDELLVAINEFDMPVVIKPVDSAGSRGVKLVQQLDELASAAQNALTESRIKIGLVEEFIEGLEVSVEGFVIAGVFYVICISEKVRTQPPYLLDEAVYFPDSLPNYEKEVLVSVAKKAVFACGLDNCPVHMELILSTRGPVVVEVAARGAGFRVFTDVIPYVTGIDTISTQLQLALGQSVEIAPNCTSSGAVIYFFPPIPGKLKNVIGLDDARSIEGVYDVDIYIQPGAIMGNLTCGADRIGHLIIFAENRDLAEEKLHFVKSLIRFEVE